MMTQDDRNTLGWLAAQMLARTNPEGAAEVLVEAHTRYESLVEKLADVTGIPADDIRESRGDDVVEWIEGVKASLPDEVMFADTGMVDMAVVRSRGWPRGGGGKGTRVVNPSRAGGPRT